MDRRRFLTTSAGCMTAAGLLAVAGTGSANEPAAAHSATDGSIDPEKLAEAAYKHFIPGKHACSESILMAACEALGISSDLVPDIALGLAGGVGLQGQTCGALTGSALSVGLAVGQKIKEYKPKKKRTMQGVGGLSKAFEKEHGCLDCRTLCGLDLTKKEDQLKMKNGVKVKTCAPIVKAAARRLAVELNAIRSEKLG